MTTPVEPEEYPTREDLARAGLVAAATALFGFLVSYHAFVRPLNRGIQLPGLDRRAAERPLPSAYREKVASGPVLDYPYTLGGAGSSARGKRPAHLDLTEPNRVLPLVGMQTTPTPTPRAAALPLPDEEYHTRTGAARKFNLRDPSSRAQQVAAAALPPPRPDPVSYAEAWHRVANGWVQFGDMNRVGGQGVVVEPGLVLTTLSALRYTGGRGFLAGTPVNTHLVAGDSAHDLALVQIEGSDGVPVPLCPESSQAGELLVTGEVTGGGFQELRSRGQVGEWLGFYGWNSGQMGGAPLVNNRGELVGLSLPRPSVDSLSWNLAVPASTIQGFLASRPQPAGAAVDSSDVWARALRSRVTPLGERTPPNRANGRVLPGQAMGNYPLGMTLEQLKSELGNGTVLEQKGSFMRLQYPSPRLTFTLADGVVVQIETDYTFYTLESGWAVGSRVDDSQLRARLPEGVQHRRDRFSAACSAGLELVLQGDTISLLRVTVP